MDDQSRRDLPLPSDRGRVRLSAPWSHVLVGDHRQMAACVSDADLESFVTVRSRVHALYIAEEHRTKRLGMIVGAALVAAAAALMVFAPPGREVMSYWVGAALVIVAAGCLGYQRVAARAKNIMVGVDGNSSDHHPSVIAAPTAES